MATRGQQIASAQAQFDNQSWKRSLELLSRRTATGIPPTAVQTPDRRHVESRSAEDAYRAAKGRTGVIV